MKMIYFKTGVRPILLLFLLGMVHGQSNVGESCFESHFKSFGVCERYSECDTAYLAQQQHGIRFDTCGHLFEVVLVCCVENIQPVHNRWTSNNNNNKPSSPGPAATVQKQPTPSSSDNTRPKWPSNNRPTITRPAVTEQQPTNTNSNFKPKPIWPSSNNNNRPAVSRPVSTAQKPTTISRPSVSSGKRISERKCDEYSKMVTESINVIALLVDAEVDTFTQPKCDYGKNPLIVGGEEAEIGEFPHMAAIGWQDSQNDGSYIWLCGGSLISERFVLSAGHCTFHSEHGTPVAVRLGDHDLRDGVRDNASPVTVKISNIIKHPLYKAPKKYDDLALFKMEYDIEFDSYVRPACLYPLRNLQKKTVIATGWGTTTNKGFTSDVLRKVSLTVYPNEECHPSEINRNWRIGFSEDQMCAGADEGGKDTCQGDSGGPLQVESPNNPCVFQIVGVTGSGGECGNSKGSGVYAIVSHYLDWIEDEVWIKNQ